MLNFFNGTHNSVLHGLIKIAIEFLFRKIKIIILSPGSEKSHIRQKK